LRGPQPDKEEMTFTRAALAMVENLDRNVGRVLEAIDAADAARDTIVVFFSDNGPNSNRWCGGMRGKKGSTDDGGVRSVCCLRYPRRIAAATRLPQITGAIDLLPTLAGLAGIDVASPRPLDGIDLTAMLIDKPQAAKRVTLAERLAGRHLVSSFRGRVSIRTQQHRLDHDGRLYNMQSDAGQTRDIATSVPEETTRLKAIAATWRDTVLKPAAGLIPEPFPVGATGAPLTELPARDGRGEGGVVRSGRAPNCSFFTDWTTSEQALIWDVDVQTAGRYTAEIWYTCPPAAVGSVVELSGGGSRSTARIGPAWDPPLNTGEDRVDRGSESYVKPFRPLSLGTIELPVGRQELRLRAVEVAGTTVADVRRLVLRPVSHQ